jgi:hypothetical protein
MSFLNFKILIGKFTKSKGIIPHLKLPKHMLLGQRNSKTKKICNSYGLMKI